MITNYQAGSKHLTGIFPKVSLKNNDLKTTEIKKIKSKKLAGKTKLSHQPYFRQPEEIFFSQSPNFVHHFKSSHILSIEFGSAELKLLYLIKTENKYYVKRSEEISFKNTFSNKPDIILDAIRSFYNNCKSKKLKVVLILHGPEVILKTIRLPIMKKEQIKEAVYWKLKQEMPSFSENDLWDYCQAGEITEDNNKWQKIVTIIAREKFVKKYLDILKKINVYPKKVIVKPLAYVHALETLTYRRIFTQKNIALIDIGLDTTLLCFFHNGALEFINTLPIGSKDIDRELSQPLIFKNRTINIKPEKMELFKRKYGIINDLLKHPEKSIFPYSRLMNNMLPVLKKYVYEIKRAVTFYENSPSGSKVQVAFITGKGSYLKNLSSFLIHELGFMVFPMGLFCRGKKASEQYQGREYTACFGAACHLGKNFNLIPKILRIAKKYKYWQKILISSSLFVFSVLLFLSIQFSNIIATNHLNNVKVKTEYQQIAESGQKYYQMTLHKKELDQFKFSLLNEFQNQSVLLKNLKILSALTPKEIVLSSIEYEGKGTSKLYNMKEENEGIIIISGTVYKDFMTSDISLLQFITKLQNLNYFKNIEIADKVKDENHKILSFKITMEPL